MSANVFLGQEQTTLINFTTSLGSTFSQPLTLRYHSNNNTVNLTSQGIFSTFKRNPHLTTGNTLTVTETDSANGAFSLTFPASESANLVSRTYFYDAKMIDSANTTYQIVNGFIYVKP